MTFASWRRTVVRSSLITRSGTEYPARRAADRDRRARRDRASHVPRARPEPSFAELRLPHPDHPGRVRTAGRSGTMLGPDGEVGRIWTLTRPAHLPSDRRPRRQGPGHPAGARQRSRPRPGGARRHRGRPPARAKRWLDTPVRAPAGRAHRAARQAGAARPGRPRQRSRSSPPSRRSSSPRSTALTSRHDRRRPRRPLAPRERAGGPPVPRPGPPSGRADASAKPELRLSARNQLRGTITAVHHGEVMSTDQGRARRRSALDRRHHQGRRRRPRPRPRRRRRRSIIKSTEVMVAKAP